MAKSKKSAKKSKLNPVNFERNIMLILLVAFLISAVYLLFRNSNANIKTEIDDSSLIIEQTQE